MNPRTADLRALPVSSIDPVARDQAHPSPTDYRVASTHEFAQVGTQLRAWEEATDMKIRDDTGEAVSLASKMSEDGVFIGGVTERKGLWLFAGGDGFLYGMYANNVHNRGEDLKWPVSREGSDAAVDWFKTMVDLGGFAAGNVVEPGESIVIS